MLFSNAVVAAAALFLAPALAAPTSSTEQYCVPHAVSDLEQAKIFAEYVDAFYVRKDVKEAFDDYIEAGYIQHNAFSAKQGAAYSEGVLETVLTPDAHFKVLHFTYSFGLGWVHSEIQGGPMFPNITAIFDVYRMNGSCIIEHWDGIQPRSDQTVNPLFPN